MPNLADQAQATPNTGFVQPQHQNTGHAAVRLGGPEDGKITTLDSDGGKVNKPAQESNVATATSLPTESSWEKAELPGLGKTYLEKDFKNKVNTWQELNKQDGFQLEFSEGFRTTKKQQSKAIQQSQYGAAKPGNSLHEAGRAVDVRFIKGNPLA